MMLSGQLEEGHRTQIKVVGYSSLVLTRLAFVSLEFFCSQQSIRSSYQMTMTPMNASLVVHSMGASGIKAGRLMQEVLCELSPSRANNNLRIHQG